MVLDEKYLQHVISTRSPENPERVRKLYHTVRDLFGSNCHFFNGRGLDDEDLRRVHSSFYLDQIREHSARPNPFSYDRDTYLMAKSLEVARWAAGGCLGLADRVMQQELDTGFALIRPPGHHAEAGRGMGFCILNNVAITAKYLQRIYGLNRILIVDFDVHHGNGTQEIFYDSSEVLFLSLHQHNIFPFSGDAAETGVDGGMGFNINVPVFPQFGDLEYTFLLGRLLQVVTEQFLPQIILVSAGYDGHRDDNISGILLSTEWFALAAKMLRQYANEVCNGKLLFILEGGYNPDSLEASVVSTMQGILDHGASKVGVMHSDRAAPILRNHPMNDYWSIGTI